MISTAGNEPLAIRNALIPGSGWEDTDMVRYATSDSENMFRYAPDPAMTSDCSTFYDNNSYSHIQTCGSSEQPEWEASPASYHISICTNIPPPMFTDTTPSENSALTALLERADDRSGSTVLSEHQPDRSWAVPIRLGPTEDANDSTGYAFQRLSMLAHQALNTGLLDSSHNENAAAGDIERRDSSGSSAGSTPVDRHRYVFRCMSIGQDAPWSPEFPHHALGYHYPSDSGYEMCGYDEDEAGL